MAAGTTGCCRPDSIDSASERAIAAVDERDGPLMTGLAALPAGQRAVLVLRFTDDLSIEEIAQAIGSRLELPVVSIPADVLMVPGYFGFLANIVTQSYPASNLITRRTLGWEPAQPGLLADLDNGHYFPSEVTLSA